MQSKRRWKDSQTEHNEASSQGSQQPRVENETQQRRNSQWTRINERNWSETVTMCCGERCRGASKISLRAKRIQSSRSTSSDRFILLVMVEKMRRFCLRSGNGNSIFLSRRPGRSRAGSRVSALLVAMITWGRGRGGELLTCY